MVHGNAVTANIIIGSRAISDPFDTLLTGLVHDDYLFDHYGYVLVYGGFPPEFLFKGTCLPRKFMSSLTLFFFLKNCLNESLKYLESNESHCGSDEKEGGQFDLEAFERWRGGGGIAAEVERWRKEGEKPFDHLRQFDKCNVNIALENKHVAMMLKSQRHEAPE